MVEGLIKGGKLCQYTARAGDLGANLDRPYGFVVSLCSLQMSN